MGSTALAVVAGLAVGIAFIIIIAIVFSQSIVQNEASQRTNAVADQNVKSARLNGSIGFDSGYTENDISSIGDWRAIDTNQSNAVKQLNRIESALQSCDRHYAHLAYGLGSMAIAIEGKDSELCSMSILWEVEMGWQLLDCNVPLEVMPNWHSWKQNDEVPQFEEISGYCTEVEYIHLTIEGLKRTYIAGEPIIFNVKAEGITDSQDILCNNYPPKITIRDDSNGEQVVLNPVRFSTTLLCSEVPMRFNVDFTFGENEEIKLDKAGSFTVVASYDDLESYEQDIGVEGRFDVIS